MEINEIENIKIIEKINWTDIWFFDNINKIGKLLARVIKPKKGDIINHQEWEFIEMREVTSLQILSMLKGE